MLTAPAQDVVPPVPPRHVFRAGGDFGAEAGAGGACELVVSVERDGRVRTERVAWKMNIWKEFRESHGTDIPIILIASQLLFL